jgi:1,4-dihydroxy-2-naphthoate polyprenyltransferase
MLKAFVQAARLRTLPLAIASISGGSILSAYFYEHDWGITLLALLTAILLQILSNFANDYGDFKKGTDDETRTDRALASGKLSEKQMKNALITTALLSLSSGILLLWRSFDSIDLAALLLFVVGIICIGAAIKYTAGKNPYGYSTLGDLAVFLFFGLVAVLGTYYLQASQFDHGFYASIIPACSIGLLASGVLNINNIRDIEGDKANGKITLAVKLGKTGAEVYQLVLSLVAILLLIYFFNTSTANDGLLIALVGILLFVHWLGLRSLANTAKNRPKYNRLLKFQVLLTLIVVILMAFILL